MSKDKQLVIAYFADEAAADAAVTEIKKWDKASKEIKLGGIGVLVKDEKGKIKTHKLGSRKTGTGAIIGVIVGILSGGVSIIGGAIVGGIIGAFFHKGLGLSKDDLAKLDTELTGGKAAVCILAEHDEAAGVAAKLAELGGAAEVHAVSQDAVDKATEEAAAAPETEAAPAAAPAADAPAADAPAADVPAAEAPAEDKPAA